MVQIYYVMHVLAGFLLVAFTFSAIATASAGKNKRLLAVTGILALVMLTGGFGLMARLEYSFGVQTWLVIKVAAWLLLTMAAGMAYRAPRRAGIWGGLAVLAISVAVLAVYLKPHYFSSAG